MGHMPTFFVDAALGQDPMDPSPTWTPWPAFKRAGIRRGRQNSLGLFQAGTATLEFRNVDRGLDPWHNSDIRPGLKVRIGAQWAANPAVYRFTGYVERVRPLWGRATADVAIDLVDAFKLFERRRFLAGHYRKMVASFGPRLYFQFKEGAGATAAENSADGADGTYIGRNLVDVDGAIHTDPDDRALNCGGNDGAVKGDATTGVSGTGSVGVAVLFYLNALPGLGDFYQLFDQKILTGAPDEYVGLRVTDAGNVIFTEGSTGAAVITSPNTVAAGQWHYALWTRSGSAHTLHVNEVKATPVLTTMDDYEAHEPHFAADAGGTIRMDGSVDETVVYAGAVPFSGATGVGGDPVAHYREAMRSSGAGQRTDQRLWSLLDEMGWPSADRVLYANGSYTLAGIDGEINTSYLAYMQKVIETENGLFYIAESGFPSFHPEQPLSPAPSSTFTLGENAGEVHYNDVEGDVSDEHIYNEFQLTGGAVPDVYLLDEGSKNTYGFRTLSKSGLLFEDHADMQARAERYRQQFTQPKKRISRVVVRGQDDPDVAFPFIIDTPALGAVGTVKRKPIGGGSEISILSEVQGVDDDITPDTWNCTLSLTPWG